MKHERSITLLLCVMFDAITIKQNLNVGICVAESRISAHACAAVCAVILADHGQHGVSSSSYHRHQHHHSPVTSSSSSSVPPHTPVDSSMTTQCRYTTYCADRTSPRSLTQTFDLLVTFLVSRRPREMYCCLLYTSPSPRDRTRSRMPSSA